MERRARSLGHSVHSALIMFPLGLLGLGVICDFVRLIGGSAGFTYAAHLMIASGFIAGMVAAVFGWIDLIVIPRGIRAKRMGVVYGIANAIVLLFYAASLYVRSNDPSHPEIAATIFSTVGAGFALIGGMLGGELLERLEVDATPRLTGQPLGISR